MTRKLVSERELLTFLNMELRKSGLNNNFNFESLVRLRVYDRKGCNWAHVNTKGQTVNQVICPTAAETLVHRARMEFNLK